MLRAKKSSVWRTAMILQELEQEITQLERYKDRLDRLESLERQLSRYDSEMSYQQLAMSRVAAVEYGRAVAVSATSGVSAIVQPDGSITQQSELYTAATLVASVPLRTTATLATRLGAWPEWVASVTGLAALALAIGARLRKRSTPARTDDTSTSEEDL